MTLEFWTSGALVQYPDAKQVVYFASEFAFVCLEVLVRA